MNKSSVLNAVFTYPAARIVYYSLFGFREKNKPKEIEKITKKKSSNEI